MWVRDRLEGLWEDEDFAGWYPRDGRPALSPAVRCRIDFKYALGLELEDPGFHHSVLSDFHDRLAVDDRADRPLDLALARLKEASLVKARGRQRTDSTYVLSAARELSRRELVTEAARAQLEYLASAASPILDELVTAEWGERYGLRLLWRAGAAASGRVAPASDPVLPGRPTRRVAAAYRAGRSAAVPDPDRIAVWD